MSVPNRFILNFAPRSASQRFAEIKKVRNKLRRAIKDRTCPPQDRPILRDLVIHQFRTDVPSAQMKPMVYPHEWHAMSCALRDWSTDPGFQTPEYKIALRAYSRRSFS